MQRITEMSGKKYNMLTVVSRSGRTGKRQNITWECVCDCGTVTIVRGDNLRSGAVKSCGCLRKLNDFNKTHGLRYHQLYGTWQNMKNRCYNKLTPFYNCYGGRGITVCQDWRTDFQSFYDWCISHGWAHGLEIDRTDNDKGYSPKNCRIVTKKINLANKGTYANNKTGYTGIHLVGNKFKVKVGTQYVGYRSTIKDAVFLRNGYICSLRLPNKTVKFKETK